MKNIVRTLFIILCVTFFSNEMNAQKMITLEHQETYDQFSGEPYPSEKQYYRIQIFDDYIVVDGIESYKQHRNNDGSISYSIWGGTFTCYGEYWYVDKVYEFPLGTLYIRSIYKVKQN